MGYLNQSKLMADWRDEQDTHKGRPYYGRYFRVMQVYWGNSTYLYPISQTTVQLKPGFVHSRDAAGLRPAGCADQLLANVSFWCGSIQMIGGEA